MGVSQSLSGCLLNDVPRLGKIHIVKMLPSLAHKDYLEGKCMLYFVCAIFHVTLPVYCLSHFDTVGRIVAIADMFNEDLL